MPSHHLITLLFSFKTLKYPHYQSFPPSVSPLNTLQPCDAQVLYEATQLARPYSFRVRAC